MIKITPAQFFAAMCVLAFHAGPAQAQNTRSFISAGGSDGNPCTRVAPCRTLQIAHNNTNPEGEINMLDPAGYGAVTITKSISIVNDGVGSAGILVPPGQTGITINGAGVVVNLRGLIIEGAGAGQTGVKFTNGKSLTIENCVVRGHTSIGILFLSTTTSNLSILNTLVSDNAASGIGVAPTGSSVTVTAVFNRVEVQNNGGHGISVDGPGATGNITAVVEESVAAHNGDVGFRVSSTSAVATLLVNRSVSINNVTGLRASNGSATLRIGQSVVTGNATSWDAVTSGILRSYADNYIDGNFDGNPAPTSIVKK
ncbi:MAG: hypothetical protein QOI12_4728 [Alphaproteobacteria bacterium]|jgi:hypothetical protein|nr:hypothetical protein [Alphaproteobacteria bacterium]